MTIRDIPSDITVEQMRKMGGWIEQTWSTTPFGRMPFFQNKLNTDGREYVTVIKTIQGDTLEFGWRISLSERTSIDHALADTLVKFKNFGEPFIDRSLIGTIYVFYNCPNCAEANSPHCSSSQITVELCITIGGSGADGFLSGYWYDKRAAVRANKWIEENRDKVKF